MNYKPVIGLEVHVELKTNSKMFCGCSADYFGKEPNTHCCPVCLGMPGALPVPNKKAIEWCVMIGLALNCEIPDFSKFDRKNYFYPDLPKGYQISQYDKPFCINGWIVIPNETTSVLGSMDDNSELLQLETPKKVRIRRVHMEEDTAKLTHATVGGEKVSLIDFNRSGVPLVEIVTEPDFRSATEVVLYLKKLQQIVRSLEVSNADLEKGDMRMEPNISLREMGSSELPKYKVEVKNINSFRFVQRAITKEENRQKEILEKGETPLQETRGWNEKLDKTISQRVKEEAHDYRYFPEPDIPPIKLKDEYKEKLEKIVKERLGERMPENVIPLLVRSGMSMGSATTIAHSPIKFPIYQGSISAGTISESQAGSYGNYIANQSLGTADVNLVPKLQRKLEEDFKQKTTNIISDEGQLEKTVKEVIEENQNVVEDYKKGKQEALQVLIGAVMKKTTGKADAVKVKSILEKHLK